MVVTNQKKLAAANHTLLLLHTPATYNLLDQVAMCYLSTIEAPFTTTHSHLTRNWADPFYLLRAIITEKMKRYSDV